MLHLKCRGHKNPILDAFQENNNDYDAGCCKRIVLIMDTQTEKTSDTR